MFCVFVSYEIYSQNAHFMKFSLSLKPVLRHDLIFETVLKLGSNFFKNKHEDYGDLIEKFLLARPGGVAFKAKGSNF